LEAGAKAAAEVKREARTAIFIMVVVLGGCDEYDNYNKE